MTWPYKLLSPHTYYILTYDTDNVDLASRDETHAVYCFCFFADVAEKPMTEKERAQARLAQLIQRVESYKPQPQHIENPQPVCDGPHCEENEARAEEQLDRSATVHVEQHRQEQTLNTKESTV